ncbi:hypothetical protein LCGC14_1929150 [marine sediment metagenome]|uniref:Methyltransferase domain-containing protein n=1 Tax=marine sediment metagenome TaxID=412755 RepID=A0A0F9FNI8_9ZZZZ
MPVYTFIPEDKSGSWAINHFYTDEKEAHQRWLAAALSGNYEYRDLEEGLYTKLSNNGVSWGNTTQMTDTPMERRTNLKFMRKAHGDILIGGLGIGLIIAPLLCKGIGKGVDSIRVVESSPDVIKLVKPHLDKLDKHGKLEVIEGDVMEYWTDDRFNVVYFDIWTNITADNLPEMSKLHRRWAHRMDKSDPDRWLSSWRHKDCQRHARIGY